MDLNELIIKTETQRNTVLELIQDPKKTVDELDKEMAVERFLKGFLDDLKACASQKPDTSESALPISDVVKRCPHCGEKVGYLNYKKHLYMSCVDE